MEERESIFRKYEKTVSVLKNKGIEESKLEELSNEFNKVKNRKEALNLLQKWLSLYS